MTVVFCRECWEYVYDQLPGGDHELCDSCAGRSYARSLGAWLLSLFLPALAPLEL